MPDNDRKIWERYSRQVLFAPIGRAGQEKLLNSRVAVIVLGALELYSPIARQGQGRISEAC